MHKRGRINQILKTTDPIGINHHQHVCHTWYGWASVPYGLLTDTSIALVFESLL